MLDSSGSLGDQAFSRRVVAAHTLLYLHGLQAVRQAEAAAKHGHVLGEDRDLALEVAGHDIAGFQIQKGGERDVAVSEARRELHFGVLDFLAEGDHPTLVLLDAVAGNAGIEDLAQWLDHGVGHRHVQVAATAINFDVETGDDDDFGRRDDVGEVRIDLGLHELELDGRDMRPRLVQIGEHIPQHHVNDSLLGGRELAAFDLRVAARAAEKVVHGGEYELRLEDNERRTPQRIQLQEVQAG